MQPVTRLHFRDAENCTSAELREAKRQAMARLGEEYIPARFSLSPSESATILLGVPVERTRLRQVLDGLGDLWELVGIAPTPPPPRARPRGKVCPCGRKLASDNVTGYCFRCLRLQSEAKDSPGRKRRREYMRASRYRGGRTCSACARPIIDSNKSGICAACRSISGDPRWEAIVASASMLRPWELRIKYSIGEKKAQEARAEARRRT